MLEFILSLLTTLPALIASGGLGAAGILGAALGLFKGPWAFIARWVGIALVCLCCFLAGYRQADDRAEMKAKIERLASENIRITTALERQKDIAESASAERDRIRDEKANSDLKVADYEAELSKAPLPTVSACVIDDADLRFRNSLRRKAATRR